MSEVALPGSIEPAARKGPDLTGAFNPITAIIFGGVIAAAVLFVAYSIYVALLIALGFEFVNGFHDTANAERQ